MFFPSDAITKLPSKNSKEWSTRGIKSYVLLMTQFMMISPSYALAHRFCNENITINRKKMLVTELFLQKSEELTPELIEEAWERFQGVLRTYDEFGDLWSKPFNAWWMEKGLDLFGYDHEEPEVRVLSRLRKNQVADEKLENSLQNYFSRSRPSEGSPFALLISLPLGTNKRQILQKISELIDKAGVAPTPRAKSAKRPLAAQRLRSKPLFTCLQLLWGRALLPKLTLAKLGVVFGVSKSNSIGIDPLTFERNDDNTENFSRMTILTHRMLVKAQHIAENAARGSFPSSEKVPLPKFDLNTGATQARIAIHRLKVEGLKRIEVDNSKTAN